MSFTNGVSGLRLGEILGYMNSANFMAVVKCDHKYLM